MPKYAHVDRSGLVIGFYDTDVVLYPNPPNDLVPLSAADWAKRMTSHHWHVVNGSLVEAPPPSASPRTLITFREFLERLTDDEKDLLAAAAQINPRIYLWMMREAASNSINLAADEFRSDLAVLVSFDVVTPKRAAELLTP